MTEVHEDILTTQDVANRIQHFKCPDYLILIAMCLLYIAVGIYYTFYKKSDTVQDYFVGGRTMSPVPIAMSIIATFYSGIAMLGIPTEIYIYGIQYIYLLLGLPIMALFFRYIYLPVLYDLKITSIYEYVEMRFDWRVNLLSTFIFFIVAVMWLAIVIYTPALAFSQVTGMNINFVMPISALVCIFYTATGGLRAVVWTDVMQITFIVIALTLLVIKGTVDLGGLDVVIGRNWESGRIEPPSFDLNPLTRHTIWSLVLGGTMFWFSTCGINQTVTQRYLSVPNFQSATRVLWLCVFGLFIIISLSVYSGMLIYATYYDCDPLTTELVKEKDQLLLMLVMDVMRNYPGLSGLFLSGIFSASMSSLSTGLNSMSAVILKDYCTVLFKMKLSSRQSYIIMKSSVLVLGAISLGFAFVVKSLGTTILQLNMSIGSITLGPTVAIFTMGILLPWINATGALIGTVSGLTLVSWICIGAQTAIATGSINFETKPTSINGCYYNFTTKPQIDLTDNYDTFPLYRLSYLWYSTIGYLISIIVALGINLIIKSPKSYIKPELITPCMRRFIKVEKEMDEVTNMKLLYTFNGTDKVSIKPV